MPTHGVSLFAAALFAASAAAPPALPLVLPEVEPVVLPLVLPEVDPEVLPLVLPAAPPEVGALAGFPASPPEVGAAQTRWIRCGLQIKRERRRGGEGVRVVL